MLHNSGFGPPLNFTRPALNYTRPAWRTLPFKERHTLAVAFGHICGRSLYTARADTREYAEGQRPLRKLLSPIRNAARILS